MNPTALRRLLDVLERFEAKDLDGVISQFAADGVFVDPHYPPPVGPAMAGHDAMRDGLAWGLGMLEQPGFTVRHELSGPDDGRVAAIEVDTNHRLVGGATLAFLQLFVGETGDDGLLRRMQCYTPYPPPPIP